MLMAYSHLGSHEAAKPARVQAFQVGHLHQFSIELTFACLLAGVVLGAEDKTMENYPLLSKLALVSKQIRLGDGDMQRRKGWQCQGTGELRPS